MHLCVRACMYVYILFYIYTNQVILRVLTLEFLSILAVVKWHWILKLFFHSKFLQCTCGTSNLEDSIAYIWDIKKSLIQQQWLSTLTFTTARTSLRKALPQVQNQAYLHMCPTTDLPSPIPLAAQLNILLWHPWNSQFIGP